MSEVKNKNVKHLVLLGASVGKSWDIEGSPKRMNSNDYDFELVTEYAFDKTKKLSEILNRDLNKPDAIIIKECAAFFPGDVSKYQVLIMNWVNLCREKKVIPVLATVVPVVKTFPLRSFLFGLLDKKIQFPIHTFDGIISFNDWIREYAKKEGLIVLDLEKRLRISSTDRHLDNKFAKRDGLHLNQKAYLALDELIIPTLAKINW
ncbi:MAG: hypothetical protein ABIC04_05280 [Nanoarchaeota archaeon]